MCVCVCVRECMCVCYAWVLWISNSLLFVVFKVKCYFEKVDDRADLVCLCVCPSQVIPRKLLKFEAVIIKHFKVTASDMRMHHMLIVLTLTFIQSRTDLNIENNKCSIISETDCHLPQRSCFFFRSYLLDFLFSFLCQDIVPKKKAKVQSSSKHKKSGKKVMYNLFMLLLVVTADVLCTMISNHLLFSFQSFKICN